MSAQKIYKFIDIGANLTDSMYKGIYNGSTKHQNDLKQVLERSFKAGLEKIILTGGSLSESKIALELAQGDDKLFTTVGCHPTRCQEFEAEGTDPKTYLNDLKEIALNAKSKVVAIGECGLDYDRLQFCPKDIQKKYFEKQLELSYELNLPLFLHCRNAAEDLQEILKKFTGLRGVVHSFDGTPEEAATFVNMGFYIGLNGCSLKNQSNLDTIVTIPEDRLMLETDCPWCEIRPTHAGYSHIKKENIVKSVKKEKWSADAMVKGRNEPCNIRQVLDIISAARNQDPTQLCDIIYNNTMKLFFPLSHKPL